jgi:hypothetical protein
MEHFSQIAITRRHHFDESTICELIRADCARGDHALALSHEYLLSALLYSLKLFRPPVSVLFDDDMPREMLRDVMRMFDNFLVTWSSVYDHVIVHPEVIPKLRELHDHADAEACYDRVIVPLLARGIATRAPWLRELRALYRDLARAHAASRDYKVIVGIAREFVKCNLRHPSAGGMRAIFNDLRIARGRSAAFWQCVTRTISPYRKDAQVRAFIARMKSACM